MVPGTTLVLCTQLVAAYSLVSLAKHSLACSYFVELKVQIVEIDDMVVLVYQVCYIVYNLVEWYKETLLFYTLFLVRTYANPIPLRIARFKLSCWLIFIWCCFFRWWWRCRGSQAKWRRKGRECLNCNYWWTWNTYPAALWFSLNLFASFLPSRLCLLLNARSQGCSSNLVSY